MIFKSVYFILDSVAIEINIMFVLHNRFDPTKGIVIKNYECKPLPELKVLIFK